MVTRVRQLSGEFKAVLSVCVYIFLFSFRITPVHHLFFSFFISATLTLILSFWFTLARSLYPPNRRKGKQEGTRKKGVETLIKKKCIFRDSSLAFLPHFPSGYFHKEKQIQWLFSFFSQFSFQFIVRLSHSKTIPIHKVFSCLPRLFQIIPFSFRFSQ